MKDMTKTLAVLLEIIGFKVAVAHNGRDAVSLARRCRPDVLLIDIGLPVLNGYQVASELRGDPTLKHAVIIAISAYSPDMLPVRPTQDDFDHYLVKPIDLERFAASGRIITSAVSSFIRQHPSGNVSCFVTRRQVDYQRPWPSSPGRQ